MSIVFLKKLKKIFRNEKKVLHFRVFVV